MANVSTNKQIIGTLIKSNIYYFSSALDRFACVLNGSHSFWRYVLVFGDMFLHFYISIKMQEHISKMNELG